MAVFPTRRTSSKYKAVEQVTGEQPELGSGIDVILRDQEIGPPSITKETGQQVPKQLTEEAWIEVDGDADYVLG